MIILAVDDEEMGLKALVSAIKKAEPDADVVSFSNPKEALAFVESNEVYAAFLDIFMPGMMGTVLGRKIKIAKPSVHVIFATGFDSYMGEAFAMHANGYVLKPITAKKIKTELDNINDLRKNLQEATKAEKKKVRFQCFGNFEVFFEDKPIRFKYDKTKEILAYMVCKRGALCDNAEIILNVWDDDQNHDSYFRGLKKDMVDCLRELGIEDILISQKGKAGINVEKVSCDYYEFLAGEPAAVNYYRGEFMSQYSWGELTNAELDMERYE